MENRVVKYNNKINSISLKNFEKIDLNFFYAICAKVQNKGSDLIEIPLEDLKKITGYSGTSTQKFREDLRRMNQKLITCRGQFETDEEIIFFNLFSTFRILKNKSILKVRVNPDMTWLLNDIESQFTSFELQEYISLNGIYSKALYRLLKQWKSQGRTPEYAIDYFKELMACPDYTPMRLRDKVIAPAIVELREKAFPQLRCEVVYARKRGRPVKGYIFYFEKEKRISMADVERHTDGLGVKSTRQKEVAILWTKK